MFGLADLVELLIELPEVDSPALSPLCEIETNEAL